MNSVKETNGNDSRTWYQDKKIRIRNTRIPDTNHVITIYPSIHIAILPTNAEDTRPEGRTMALSFVSRLRISVPKDISCC